MGAFDYFIREHDKQVAARPSMIKQFKQLLQDKNINYKRCICLKDAYDEPNDEYKTFFENKKDAEKFYEEFGEYCYGIMGDAPVLIIKSTNLKKILE